MGGLGISAAKEWIAGFMGSAGGLLFGSTMATIATKTFSTLATGLVYISFMGFLIFSITTVFAFISSLPDMMAQWNSIQAVGHIIDVLGLVKPYNFNSCVSLVSGIAITKFCFRMYMILWLKLYNFGFSAVK